MQNTSPEKAKAINFDNCFLAELATHRVVVVGGNPDQPGFREEVYVPKLFQILAWEEAQREHSYGFIPNRTAGVLFTEGKRRKLGC